MLVGEQPGGKGGLGVDLRFVACYDAAHGRVVEEGDLGCRCPQSIIYVVSDLAREVEERWRHG